MTDPLNKHIALQMGISRREADSLIEHGHVRVNGTKAILGGRIEPGDELTVKNQPVGDTTTFQYVLLNKPVDYVSSRKQQGDAPTIYALLPESLHTLKPVGRLDRDSSGLLLLSNDGDFAFAMTHPKFYKTKQYEVTLDSPLAPLHQQMINDYGVTLDDGPSKLTLQRENDERTDWTITMTEGRNRQIRRTFDSLGYTVIRLHRTHFGPYALDDLASGDYRLVEKR